MPLKLPPGATLAPDQGKTFGVHLPPGAKPDPAVERFLKSPRQDTPKEDKEPDLKELYGSLSQPEKDAIFNSLTATDQAKLMDKLGMWGHATGFSAQPDFNSDTMAHILSGHAMEDPWVKQKVTNLVYNTAHWLPAAGGTAGGIAGGIAGAGLGKTPQAAMAGKVIGSGVGAGGGEAMRQWIDHEMGWEDQPLTAKDRMLKIAKEAGVNAGAEAFALGLGRLLRPTMAKSIAKLYYAGGLDVGDKRLKGAVESVAEDFAAMEKAGVGKATTVGDFIHVLNATKDKIGQEVNSEMLQPITQNGKRVMLGHAMADTTGIQAEIRSLLTASPSVMKEAAINPTGESAAALKDIEATALKYQKGTWTYFELCDKRIRLNQELEAVYSLPAGEQRKYFLEHPGLLVKKKEADAIREVTYRQMDLAAGRPMGYTQHLQEKRGVLMSLATQADHHLRQLLTESRWEQGAPLSEKLNVSTFGTTSGRPGFAVHRLHRLVHQPTQEDLANRQVARAFGHTVGTKVGKIAGSRPGEEAMALPVRWLFGPEHAYSEELEDQKDREGETGGEAAAAPAGSDETAAPAPPDEFISKRLPALISQAKGRRPAAPPKRYKLTATGPGGHRIGSDDGIQWFDLQTQQQVK